VENQERHSDKKEGGDGRKRKNHLTLILVLPANCLGGRVDQKYSLVSGPEIILKLICQRDL
jgi:hypothetical protein